MFISISNGFIWEKQKWREMLDYRALLCEVTLLQQQDNRSIYQCTQFSKMRIVTKKYKTLREWKGPALPQKMPQKFHGQVTVSRSKVTGSKNMSVHTYPGHSRWYKNLKVKAAVSRSIFIWFQKHSSAQLPIISNVHTKLGDCSPNILDTAGSTRLGGQMERQKHEWMDTLIPIGHPQYCRNLKL